MNNFNTFKNTFLFKKIILNEKPLNNFEKLLTM